MKYVLERLIIFKITVMKIDAGYAERCKCDPTRPYHDWH